MNRQSAVFSALAGTSLQSSADTAEADRYEAKIRDFIHCPKCNSTDLKQLSDEEFESLQKNQNNIATVLDPVEEIKKMKELLDMGILTQEEFDTKKKQLLGL